MVGAVTLSQLHIVIGLIRINAFTLPRESFSRCSVLAEKKKNRSCIVIVVNRLPDYHSSRTKLHLSWFKATLVEETDSSLIRILGEESFKLSTSDSKDSAFANKGLKAWWAKMGQRFRSLSNAETDSLVSESNVWLLCCRSNFFEYGPFHGLFFLIFAFSI